MIILILLLGAGLLYALQRLIYVKYWDKGLSADIHFNERSAYEGEKSSLTEIVENRSYLPIPYLNAKFRIGSGLIFNERENLQTSDQNYKNDIFSVLFFQRITRKLEFRCEKRGYYAIREAQIISSDLFFSAHMVHSFPQHSYFYVYPKRVDTSSFEQPIKKMIGDVTSRQFLYPDPFEFRGLRNYTPQDPMNTINWKASAKTGDLMVNQFDSTNTKRIVVLLNLQDETLIEHPALHEDAIRVASTIAADLLSEGFPVKLVTNGRDMETKEPVAPIYANGPSQIPDILRAMARIDLTLEKEDFAPFMEAEMKDPDFLTAGYLFVSANQSEPLQLAFKSISDRTSAFWIIPLFDNMTEHAGTIEDALYTRWRVKGFA